MDVDVRSSDGVGVLVRCVPPVIGPVLDLVVLAVVLPVCPSIAQIWAIRDSPSSKK